MLMVSNFSWTNENKFEERNISFRFFKILTIMHNILIYDSLDTSQLHLGPCFGSFITQYVLNGMRKQKGRCQLQACLFKK